MNARYDSYRFADDIIEAAPSVQLNDLTPDALEELAEEALMQASADDLITALVDLGLPEYAAKYIALVMKRVQK